MIRTIATAAVAMCLTACASISSTPSRSLAEIAAETPGLSTLNAAVQAAGLGDALSGSGPLTVFAPTDAAFAALPPGVLDALLLPENKAKLVEVLTYHVAPGKLRAENFVGKSVEVTTLNGAAVAVDGTAGVTVNGVSVATADVLASNGVAHVIDAVLLPPNFTLDGAEAPSADISSADILGVAEAAGQFTTLLAAIDAAGLTEALMGEGPFTVFAPTDEAFGQLPAGTVETLLKPENRDQLAAILTYHVVPGAVFSEELAGAQSSAVTLEGSRVEIDGRDGVTVNGSAVIAADVLASNGVIHVIDGVLLPPR